MAARRTANLLGALAHELAGRLDRRLKTHANETDSAAAALNVIGFSKGCSNAALSAALKLSHSATVRLVDKLEAAGLVESRPGRDRRSVALSLTKAGRKRIRHVVQDRTAALGEVVQRLSPPQQAHLDDIAATLLRLLTSSASDANHICRLCDTDVCPPDDCPVHQAGIAAQ